MSLIDIRTNVERNIDLFFNEGTQVEPQIGKGEDVYQMIPPLKKNLIQEVKIKLEIATLEKYIKEKITPRGLRYDKMPTYNRNKQKFLDGWKEMLEGFSSRTMEYIIEDRKEELPILSASISTSIDYIESHTTEEEIKGISKDLESVISKVEK